MNRRTDFTAQLEPTLRFPEFTGEWQEKRLGEVFDAARGSSLSWGDIEADGKNKAILYGQLYTIYPEVVSQVVSRTNSNKGTPSKNGDLLLPNSTTTTGIDLANATALNEDGVLLGGDITILRFKETGSSIFYAYYLSHFMKYKLAAYGQGSTIVHMYFSQYKNMKIVEPSVAEQQKIAVFLAAVDKRVVLLERKVQQLEAYKCGVIQQLFSQQLRFTRPDGSHFPVWQEKRLRDVADVIGGGTPDTKNPRYWGDDIVWLTPSEVKSKYIDNSIRKISHEGLLESSAKILPINTVILTSRATVGDVAIARKELATNQGFQSLVPHKSEDSEFLYYLVTTNKKEFLRRASGSTFLEISNRDVKSIPVRIPILAEQQKIAAFLSALDEKIALTRQQLDKTKQFKKGLLQRMFV